jgi:hypothetical protein
VLSSCTSKRESGPAVRRRCYVLDKGGVPTGHYTADGKTTECGLAPPVMFKRSGVQGPVRRCPRCYPPRPKGPVFAGLGPVERWAELGGHAHYTRDGRATLCGAPLVRRIPYPVRPGTPRCPECSRQNGEEKPEVKLSQKQAELLQKLTHSGMTLGGAAAAGITAVTFRALQARGLVRYLAGTWVATAEGKQALQEHLSRRRESEPSSKGVEDRPWTVKFPGA